MKWEQRTYIGITWPPYQQMPRPHQEISQSDFMRLMFCGPYSVEGIFYFPLWLSDDDKMPWSVRFFWFPDYGLAVATNYTLKGSLQEQQTLPGLWIPDSPNAGYQVRFFRVGCEHHYVELSPTEIERLNIIHGDFDHVYQCAHCGNIQHTNSSG
jgi:hypothetical protein